MKASAIRNAHSVRYRMIVSPLVLAALVFLVCQTEVIWAAEGVQPFMPLSDLKPGMKGIGRTVFTADKVEEFEADILGVLENVAPKQSAILARLSGGPLERTGVMGGMSGSPVYIDGKIIGAVAFSFPFSKEATWIGR